MRDKRNHGLARKPPSLCGPGGALQWNLTSACRPGRWAQLDAAGVSRSPPTTAPGQPSGVLGLRDVHKHSGCLMPGTAQEEPGRRCGANPGRADSTPTPKRSGLPGDLTSSKHISLRQEVPAGPGRRPNQTGCGTIAMPTKLGAKLSPLNQDGLACALKADSCDDGSEFQEVDVFLG